MTEVRANVAAAAPLSSKAPGSKLSATAKEFVFNSAAPAWTPTASAPASAPAQPQPQAKSSALKPSAKAFVPSFLAAPFVPATIAPPTSAAASPVAPVIVGQRSDAFAKRAVSTAATVAVVENATTSSSTATTTTTTTTTTSTTTTTTMEPEAEDAPKAEETTTVVVEQQQTTTVQVDKKPEPLRRPEATVGINGAVQPAAPAPVVEEVKVEVQVQQEVVQVQQEAQVQETEKETEEETVTEEEQVIQERILYTIKQLLEMEPENCPMPPGVKGMVVAADKTSKTSVALAEAAAQRSGGGGGGGGGSRGGDSRRSLRRNNSSSEGGRGRRDRGGRGRGHHVDTAPALEDCEPLNINEETRWKPSVAKSRLDEPEDTSDASLKEAKSILNKLSIEKFEKLSDQLILVAVRGLEVLKGVIEMVIEKAQMEWHFSAMYAELCAKLAKTSMPAITLADNEVVTDTNKLFRKLLLQRCQKEFEDKPSVEGLEELPEEERAEKELLVKRATLGHIRFVGELFKQRMLSSRIMHECISILFGDVTAPDEESLECLCKLLSTIGQALELNAREQAERDHINKYYGTIKVLGGDSKLLCTRVRFMLQDLLELRRNNWVARRKETKAMTIAEVHAEVAREAKEKEKAAKSGGGARLQRSQSMNAGGTDRRRGSQSIGSNGGAASSAWKARAASSNNLAALASASSSSSSPSTPVADDGWSTVSGGAKPKLVKSRSNSDRFPSSMGAPRHPNGASAGRGLGGNAFASLRQDDRPRKERSRSNSASSNSSRGLGRPPVATKPSSPSRSSSPESSKPAAEQLSADAFEKKAKAILEEYVELRDLDEVVASLSELNSSEHHGLLASQALNLGLEKGNKEREAVSTLLAGLLEQELLSTDSLVSSLDELLEFIEDIEIDIPKALPYMSEMLAPTVAAGGLPLPRLVSSVQHLTQNGKAAKLVGGTLSAIQDEAKVRELVVVNDEAVIEFAPLLAEDQREDPEALRVFYETHSLTVLL